MSYDDRARRKSYRNLRVTGAATAAVDHLWRCAKEGSKASFQSALVYWFDQIAEEYEAEVATLRSALDAKRSENHVLRKRYGLPPSGTMPKVEED